MRKNGANVSAPKVVVPITLVLADDHPLVLNGLTSLLAREPDIEVLACCTDGLAALKAVDEHRPDILVLDVRMPRLDGWEVLRELRRRGLRTRSILLAAELRPAQLAEAATLGVRGLLLKDAALDALVQCIRTVDEGGQWPPRRSLAEGLDGLLKRSRGEPDPAASLTSRELEVVRCVARGLRNRQIAGELAINEGTVKVHLHNACRKLNVEGRLALSLYARDKGIA